MRGFDISHLYSEVVPQLGAPRMKNPGFTIFMARRRKGCDPLWPVPGKDRFFSWLELPGSMTEGEEGEGEI